MRFVAPLLTLATLAFAPAARASHVNVVIDGDLTDLINAVNANLGPANGGFTAPDPLGDTYTGPCAYVNGYDLRQSYVLLDFTDAMGNLTPNDITLYAGWDMEGVVGDVDGDGNPNVFSLGSPGNLSGCALSDETGIGPNESYNVLLDLNCAGGVDDIRIQIKAGAVSRVDNTVAPPVTTWVGATFNFTGSTLELKVPNYQTLLAGLEVSTDLCDARFRLTANAEFDGPGEDFSSPFQLMLSPSIDVEKNPPTQAVCAGENVEWTITITNDGLCLLDEIVLEDILGAGLTYVSSGTAPTSVNGQTVRWELPNADLEPGDQIQITLTASTQDPCSGAELTNTANVEGLHFSSCAGPEDPGATASDTDSATIECHDKPPCSIDGPTTAQIGGSVTVTTTEDPAVYMPDVVGHRSRQHLQHHLPVDDGRAVHRHRVHRRRRLHGPAPGEGSGQSGSLHHHLHAHHHGQPGRRGLPAHHRILASAVCPEGQRGHQGLQDRHGEPLALRDHRNRRHPVEEERRLVPDDGLTGGPERQRPL
jgi:uncharacterized repeat protein (TIGR01451 family)